MKRLLILFCLLIPSLQSFTQEHITTDSMLNRLYAFKKEPFTVGDVVVFQYNDWSRLFRIPKHPAFDNLLTPDIEKKLLTEINERKHILGKDTLWSSDLLFIWKPYFDWLRYHDPHFTVDLPIITTPSENINHSEIPRLSFTYLLINDTLLVDKSLDPLFKKGDMILSVNNIDISKYLEYNYKFRYYTIDLFIEKYYFNNISDTFNVELLRDDKRISVKSSGLSNMRQSLLKWDYDIKEFDDIKTIYINIGAFENNKKIINTLSYNIKKYKKRGYCNVILDLRKNPGGSGDRFDELISIFIDKPIVRYQKGAKLKVSKDVLPYYDFLREDMVGQLIDLPYSEIVEEFKTKPKMYIDGMDYYVLISENTGSVAATFSNILQYNDAAKLVGEPLLHNALKYGEIIGGVYLHDENFTPCLLHSTGISTIEYDEYTKAIDGILMPDIHIPYIANDYLTGKDAMLNKLLSILKQTSHE